MTLPRVGLARVCCVTLAPSLSDHPFLGRVNPALWGQPKARVTAKVQREEPGRSWKWGRSRESPPTHPMVQPQAYHPLTQFPLLYNGGGNSPHFQTELRKRGWGRVIWTPCSLHASSTFLPPRPCTGRPWPPGKPSSPADLPARRLEDEPPDASTAGWKPPWCLG